MATRLSFPITGNAEQARDQIRNRLDATFGRRDLQQEFVFGAGGALTEIQIIFSDDVPVEEIRAFRRALANISGREGVEFTIPSGTGGTASLTEESDFDAQTSGASPTGFATVGSVTIDAPAAVGPTTLTTIGGVPATLDLSTTPITVGLPIQPTTLSITVTISASTETITDDGAGNLSGTGGSLPAGGTVNYVTGAMTGTTATLDATSDVDESHTTDVSLSPLQSVNFDSGAVAGDATLTYIVNQSVGAAPDQLSWTFNLNFPANFGLNNNGVTGAQTLTLEARLLNATVNGRDIVLRWTVSSDNVTPPTAWGTPAFVGTLPTSAPTAGLAIPIDATFYEVTFRRAGASVLGVSMGGTEELFTFADALAVPNQVVINHNWGDALDRFFSLDDWSLSFTLPIPALT